MASALKWLSPIAIFCSGFVVASARHGATRDAIMAAVVGMAALAMCAAAIYTARPRF